MATKAARRKAERRAKSFMADIRGNSGRGSGRSRAKKSDRNKTAYLPRKLGAEKRFRAEVTFDTVLVEPKDIISIGI